MRKTLCGAGRERGEVGWGGQFTKREGRSGEGEKRRSKGEDQAAAAMSDMTERLAVARKKAEALKSEIAKAQNDKKDCSIQEAAAQIDLKNLGPGLKARRVLKGHFGKVYAMHWSGDNQNLVSASQVRREFSISVCCLLGLPLPSSAMRVSIWGGKKPGMRSAPGLFFPVFFFFALAKHTHTRRLPPFLPVY